MELSLGRCFGNIPVTWLKPFSPIFHFQVLGIIGTVIIKDHEYRQNEFHQLAYHRMFVMLLLELNAPEPVLEAINFQILSCFANVFHDLRPSRAPGFAYAWLEMIAHRTLMSKLLLNSPQQKVLHFC